MLFCGFGIMAAMMFVMSGRLYTVNDSYFDSITDARQAYWLGFIAADGNIYRNQVIIYLQAGDKHHLRRFVRDVGGTYKVRCFDRDGKRYCYVRISSKPMVSALARLGVMPAKTFKLTWPANLMPGMLKHYLLGYTDADGGFCALGGKKARFYVTGNTEFITSLQTYLVVNVGLSKVKLHYERDDNKIATLAYTGNRQVAKIVEFLYRDATLFLPRKVLNVLPLVSKHLQSDFVADLQRRVKALLDEEVVNGKVNGVFGCECQSDSCDNGSDNGEESN